MKKIVLLIFLTFLISGCVNISDSSYEDIIKYAINSKYINLKNQSYSGFNFYLPNGLHIENKNKNSLILKKNNVKLYMYVDLISYYNKTHEKYFEKAGSYYSKEIINGDNFGYLEINSYKNDKYLVEIMYNYAKIEVIVAERDLKSVVTYAILLLSSINYNDTIVKNMVEENTLNYNEVEFNIFETAKDESNFIEYDDNSSDEYEDYEEIKDTDLIN